MNGRNVLNALAFTFTLSLTVAGCDSRDNALVGLWQGSAIQYSPWDSGDLPPDETKIYEFNEDGSGRVKLNARIQTIEWSTTGTHSLRVEYPGREEVYGYVLKDQETLAITDAEHVTVLYKRRTEPLDE